MSVIETWQHLRDSEPGIGLSWTTDGGRKEDFYETEDIQLSAADQTWCMAEQTRPTSRLDARSNLLQVQTYHVDTSSSGPTVSLRAAKSVRSRSVTPRHVRIWLASSNMALGQ